MVETNNVREDVERTN